MNLNDLRREKWKYVRWMKMSCHAKLKSLLSGETSYGECTYLSVDGIAIRTSFVPQYGEPLEVTMVPPAFGREAAKRFVVEAEVRHCHELEHGKLYELGMVITRRKN